MKLYNTIIYKSKNIQEYYFNLDSFTAYDYKRKGIEEKRRKFEELNTKEKVESINKRERYYKEKKADIRRLIDCNYVRYKSSFLTLTFKENLQDIVKANSIFTNFIRRFKRYLKKNNDIELKYIATWELQKRGAIHYHIVLFNVPFVDKNYLQNEIWKQGFVKINRISSNVHNENRVADYITKYFAKDLIEKVEYKKAYFNSKNLIQPKETKRKVDYDYMNDVLNNEDIVYVKEFEKRFYIGEVDGEKVFDLVKCLYVKKSLKKIEKKDCKKDESMLELNDCSKHSIFSTLETINKKELINNSSLFDNK